MRRIGSAPAAGADLAEPDFVPVEGFVPVEDFFGADCFCPEGFAAFAEAFAVVFAAVFAASASAAVSGVKNSGAAVWFAGVTLGFFFASLAVGADFEVVFLLAVVLAAVFLRAGAAFAAVAFAGEALAGLVLADERAEVADFFAFFAVAGLLPDASDTGIDDDLTAFAPRAGAFFDDLAAFAAGAAGFVAFRDCAAFVGIVYYRSLPSAGALETRAADADAQFVRPFRVGGGRRRL